MSFPFPEVCPVVLPVSGPHRVRLAELVELVKAPLLGDRDGGDECDCEDCECS